MNRWIASALILTLGGCAQTSSEGWEAAKTAGRYMGRGIDSLMGKDYESRMLGSEDEFMGPYEEDYIALSESDLRNAFGATDTALGQPRGVPGEKGIPHLDQFYQPSGELSAVFRLVHFQTDEHVIRERNDVEAVLKMADYLKKHPQALVLIEGHCDERASAAYNLALGMRRANHVRVLLAKQGVDPNRVYTVSRGKEAPLAMGHNPDDWHENRRAAFRIYEK